MKISEKKRDVAKSTTEDKILDLELRKKILLNEDEILWDEVHAVQRDLDYLKSIQK
jgi:hypothetical protein